MKIFKQVRGTMDYVPSVFVDIDTVYIRSNITRIEELEFSGWEYDEIQYKKDNYIELISNKSEQLEEEVADVWFENMVLDSKIDEETSALWFEIMQGGM